MAEGEGWNVSCYVLVMWTMFIAQRSETFFLPSLICQQNVFALCIRRQSSVICLYAVVFAECDFLSLGTLWFDFILNYLQGIFDFLP